MQENKSGCFFEHSVHIVQPGFHAVRALRKSLIASRFREKPHLTGGRVRALERGCGRR